MQANKKQKYDPEVANLDTKLKLNIQSTLIAKNTNDINALKDQNIQLIQLIDNLTSLVKEQQNKYDTLKQDLLISQFDNKLDADRDNEIIDIEN